MPQNPDGSAEWPGSRLGLPRTGPRSIARPGRRLAALLVDWGSAVLISVAFFDYDAWANLGVFALVQVVSIGLLAGSPGHLLLGMRVVPTASGPLGAVRPLVRTLLLCAGVPALIWDRDQRGMHDRWAGTVLVRV